ETVRSARGRARARSPPAPGGPGGCHGRPTPVPAIRRCWSRRRSAVEERSAVAQTRSLPFARHSTERALQRCDSGVATRRAIADPRRHVYYVAPERGRGQSMVARGVEQARVTQGGVPTVQVFTLGGFRVLVGGRAVEDSAWRRRSARRLFKVLLSR